jgi:5-methylcytosine-specific restriction endonuclease McrA
MPIKPENRTRYPKDWKAIRANILARAGNACEWPGCEAKNGKPNPITGSQVVLTIAHLDHTPENCSDDNLRAWCQMHHLRYDHAHHLRNAATTRRRGRAVGDLFGSDPP